ncbi:MAG: Rrf2 family transcriptional regulator [Gallionellaceae bacterium]|jgi:Rrf2 family nitric oxide-sensitive transcriptional repressor|nr:Rrf2 family transcriptional regulator [Gallionellaceae bacterium]
MRLTHYTDYSLRVLIYLAYKKGEIATVSEIADFHKISRNHLVKVVHNLGLNGYLITARGKGGGIRLARAPEDIHIGEVLRNIEPDFHLLECFDTEQDQCVITRVCNLKPVLFDARNAFFETLDKYTLADTIKPSTQSSPMFKSIPVVHA